jgi:GTP cyclohydrolase I
MKVSEKIKQRLIEAGVNYHADDNISAYVEKDELVLLEKELTESFKSVLNSLVIDTENDPNSKNTAHRLAKMYLKELMSGRYESRPDATAFPNVGENAYTGMLVVRSELKSVCSHHHQPVSGVAYIGIIPKNSTMVC